MIYTGENLKEISFPLGGIGTGCIGIAGNGRFCDWEIFNRPNKGSINGYSHISVKAEVNGKKYIKVLNGDLTKDLIGQYSKRNFTGYGYGPSSMTMCGFPHFKNVIFDGEFPIAKLTLTDDNFPGKVILTAFNPFIPLDADNSGIPAAFLNIEFINDTDNEITYTAVLSVCNPFESSVNEKITAENIKAVKLINAAVSDSNAIGYGDLTVAAYGADSGAQEYWYRGRWQDSIVMFRNELSGDKELTDRHYDTPGRNDTCSVYRKVKAAKSSGESVKFIISWNYPNNYNYWSPLKDENGKDVIWKNYYSKRFSSSYDSAVYSLENWDDLYTRTLQFKNELFSSTLDRAVIDAASATLSVLKSPTVWRLENGEFYGWEGVHEQEGSCEGSCQHVWNYAYALCFLFPELERSMRDVELKYALDGYGGTDFRIKLPLGRDKGFYRSCVDGHMGTVIKIYREWKLSGNDTWLSENWSKIKSMISFAWSKYNKDAWDRDCDGVLEGRQHHTLDMELFAPSSWLEGFYLAALKAGAEMASYLGDTEAQNEYNAIYQKGTAWCRDNLFNGKYFIQKIDLTDKALTDRFGCSDIYWNSESGEIKYQIGEGCEIDQLCGQWHANICGLGRIFDKNQTDIALDSLYHNNYKSSMREFTNPWRIFALNDESAAIICDYPEGARKPAIPVPYCEESMNGFEYQLAGLLISEGRISEGLDIVRAVRSRYNGQNRNPFNEIECGSNYARSMASFALLPIFSGFCFDLPHKAIGFSPIINGEYFRCIWSVGTGWGNIIITSKNVKINLISGILKLNTLKLPFISDIKELYIDGHITDFKVKNGDIVFPETEIDNAVEIIL